MVPAARPDLPPPVATVGAIGWLRENLFSSPLNAALTVLALLLLYHVIPPFLRWAVLDATFAGDSRDACVGDGACWVFVRVRFLQFIYGFYPADERWRVNLTVLAGVLPLIPLFIPRFPAKTWLVAYLLSAFPVIAFVLLTGGVLGLTRIETSLWGGLMLTLVIATVGIVVSLPIGVVLALGRRSEMPMVRLVCTAFIELWRAVPLITVLFMASVMLPLFLPQGVNFDKLLRALFGVAMFASAYMAEVIRGGLQAIPRGQHEAAKALGLGYWQAMVLIVLPQALRMVIPGIVNTFIGLFKDTSLVLIIGLFDLLGIVQAAVTDPKWIGLSKEGYVFAGFGFWIFCFGMSRYSQRLERRLAAGERRR